ncbi:MAG: hypothetical protein QTN59_06530 [Candidatus Electrothrix communis]|nr:MAG: hypothetical protein QTN59_06530 [Candidatus Electrothrix communis]
MTGLLEQHVFVSVKVEKSNETKYILKIKNSSKRRVEIIKLIADPPTLLKNNSFTSFNNSKFFQNKTLPPGESIDFHFYPKQVNDLREMGLGSNFGHCAETTCASTDILLIL